MGRAINTLFFGEVFAYGKSEVIFDSEVVLRTVKFFAVQKGWLYFNNPITLP